ncbi:hypothetical protein Bbelb_131810 [Branchiostoma belcheri]|nr:hypothetical protein Bbelb_131810 [Branchiostoma belcheri]
MDTSRHNSTCTLDGIQKEIFKQTSGKRRREVHIRDTRGGAERAGGQAEDQTSGATEVLIDQRGGRPPAAAVPAESRYVQRRWDSEEKRLAAASPARYSLTIGAFRPRGGTEGSSGTQTAGAEIRHDLRRTTRALKSTPIIAGADGFTAPCNQCAG